MTLIHDPADPGLYTIGETMGELARQFYRNPVFALAVLQAALGGLAVAISSGPVFVAAGIALVAIEAAKRQLVTPNVKVSRRRQ